MSGNEAQPSRSKLGRVHVNTREGAPSSNSEAEVRNLQSRIDAKVKGVRLAEVILTFACSGIAAAAGLLLGVALLRSWTVPINPDSSWMWKWLVKGETAPSNIAEWLFGSAPAWDLVVIMAAGAAGFALVEVACIWVARRISEREAASLGITLSLPPMRWSLSRLKDPLLRLCALVTAGFVAGLLLGLAGMAFSHLANSHIYGFFKVALASIAFLVLYFFKEFVGEFLSAVQEEVSGD